MITPVFSKEITSLQYKDNSKWIRSFFNATFFNLCIDHAKTKYKTLLKYTVDKDATKI